MLKEPPKNSREKTKNLLLTLQDNICTVLENVDGKGKFTEESWLREEGGGGRSRVLKNGSIFEQAGVNFSEVQGKELPQSIISQRPEAKGHQWFATGTSMVLHPKNPYIPTVHLNYRYFEAGPVWWFGGGADLTPFYPYLSDVRNFHKEHKKLATITSVSPPGRFGSLDLNENTVNKFEEKPKGDGGRINGGFFVFNSEIFNYVKSDQTMLEKEPLQKLVKLGQLKAYKHKGFWQCMDTLRDKELLNKLINTGKIPWKIDK